MLDNTSQRRELAEFIRSRREKLDPEDCGFSKGERRRTSGLRREEIASLVGVSVSWYTKLEQGRDIQVSTRCLDQLAEALKLNFIEKEQLFSLGLARSDTTDSSVLESVLPSIQRMIDAMQTSPAVIMTARMDYLGSNAALNIAFGRSQIPELQIYDSDYNKDSDIGQNILRQIFLDDKVKHTLPAWYESARYQVSVFRAAFGRHSNDPSFINLVEELLSKSEDFKEIWSNYELFPNRQRSLVYGKSCDKETIFEVCTFYADVNESIRLDIYTPQIT